MSARAKGLVTGVFSQGNNQSRREMNSQRWVKFSLSLFGQKGSGQIRDNGPVWTRFGPDDTFSYRQQSRLEDLIPSSAFHLFISLEISLLICFSKRKELVRLDRR